MVSEKTRELNSRERRQLEAALEAPEPAISFRELGKSALPWTVLICVSGGFAFWALYRGPYSLNFALILGLSCTFMAGCIFALFSIVQYGWHQRAIRKWRAHSLIPESRQLLADGKVQVRRVEARAVYLIDEFEDEGPAYLFEVGANEVLLLVGQRYLPADQDVAWPNDCFEIVRGAGSGTWIGVFCYGNQLIPERTINSAELRKDVFQTEHEELISGSLSTALNLLMA